MLLEAINLSVSYGKVNALNNVSFNICDGEIIALMGANGSGKSTSLKAISGLLIFFGGKITEGEVILNGVSIKNFQTHELAHKGLAVMPEGRGIFANMSIRENLEMGAFIRKDKKLISEDIDYVFDIFPELKHKSNKRAGILSGGEQQMLSLGRALMLKPKLILADEPYIGLSPYNIELISEKFIEVNKNGISIILVEQKVTVASHICDRGYIFENGEIVFSGSKGELTNNEKVQKFYLGN
jgi:branched-chain amino acid transport system ATP-binding protein